MTVEGMGNFYTPNPVNTFPLGYLPAIYPHLGAAGNAGHAFGSTPFGQTGYDHHVFGQAGPLQNHYGSESGYYGPGCSPARHSPQYDRHNGRRQNAVKVQQHHRGRSSNPASAHHNHVEINRIQQGTDVRTTVSIPRSWFG
jgi:hypothetical protein